MLTAIATFPCTYVGTHFAGPKCSIRYFEWGNLSESCSAFTKGSLN
jgi:hypothetical protein